MKQPSSAGAMAEARHRENMARDPLPPIGYALPDWERQYPDRRRDDEERSPAEIDRSRIIHCAAFRRLQGKTQIFGVSYDDFFRTRLTHSLEVAQIAKGLALICGASTELVEAISLAHDIGHPPFGHAGERALAACLAETDDTFESNAQNLRTLTRLEFKRPEHPGLNLTRATLDGLLKHKEDGVPLCYASETAVVAWVTRGGLRDRLALEAQIVDWADQVAYSVHDLEDGIHAGLITAARLSDTSLRATIHERMAERYSRAAVDETYEWLMKQVRTMEEMGDARRRATTRKELTSQLIHRFVTAAKPHRRSASAERAESQRYAQTLFIAAKNRGMSAVLQAIARQLVVHDQRVATLERRSGHVIRQLFEALTRPDAVDLYPDEFRQPFGEARTAGERARVASDYIAEMTDSYADMMFQRLYAPGPSIFSVL